MRTENNPNPILDNLDNIPPLLYKYRTFDECGYGMEMAVHGRSYFSSAVDFNDPFDCYFIPISKATQLPLAKLKRYIKQKVKQHFPESNRAERRNREKQALQRMKEQKHNPRAFIPDVLEVQYRNIGVLSLTQRYNSLPMWAYYADNHSGLCIGLRTEVIGKHQIEMLQQGQVLSLYNVQYTDNVPVVTVDHNPGVITEEERNEIARTFYTKSNAWKHESETRLIFWHYAKSIYEFGTDAVGEIIIGARAESVNIEALLSALRDAKSSAVVKRAVRSHNNFSLDFEHLQ